jgi:hypothetical protein
MTGDTLIDLFLICDAMQRRVHIRAVTEPTRWKGRAGPTLRFGPAHISSIENKKKD